VLFAFSSFSWTIAGAVMKDYSLMVLQLAFLIVDLIGIWRWLVVANKVMTPLIIKSKVIVSQEFFPK